MLPTGSVCHWKSGPMAFPEPLLNADACKEKGCDGNPCEAFAVPVLGNCSAPREMRLPLTSRLADGVAVLMPIMPAPPDPV